MSSVTLNNGVEMPMVGFGVFQIEPDAVVAAVDDALQSGYRLIDTAAAYRNEEGVGAAIAGSGVAREDVFVTTKLWIQDAPAEQNALAAFERSLDRLGLDYVDLYLIHQPYGDLYAQWRALEALYDAGRARAIGVSNLAMDRLLDLVANARVTPAVDQLEVNPFHQQPAAHEVLLAEGVQLQGWGPFASGKNGLFDDPVLADIAQRRGRSVGQIVIRWLVQRGIPSLPKSVRPERMRENRDVFDFELTADEMDRIASLDRGRTQFVDHADPDIVRWLSARRIA